MENNGKVSIIVPVYKSKAFLDKCVSSILNQTYQNVELILVDDGSPDNSGKMCDDYAARDNRVVVIHKENGGTCEARNEGLKRVTGQYLMFADGDDWLAEDCIEYLMSIMKETGSDMAMTDCVFTTRNLKQNDTDFLKKLTPEQAACEILYVKTPVGPWNKLYTTEIVNKNNLTFSVPWFGEGLWFSVMAAQYSHSIAYGHRKVYIYRKNNPNSGTTVRNVQHGLNSLQNIKYIKEQLVIKTPATIHAADWHIWNNYFNLVMFIVGAHAESEYTKEYQEALHMVKKMMPEVFKNSDLSGKRKAYILGVSTFPRTVAKCALSLKRYMFKKDIQNVSSGGGERENHNILSISPFELEGAAA